MFKNKTGLAPSTFTAVALARATFATLHSLTTTPKSAARSATATTSPIRPMRATRTETSSQRL